VPDTSECHSSWTAEWCLSLVTVYCERDVGVRAETYN